MSTAAMAVSRRVSHSALEPMPTGMPSATTTKEPPDRVAGLDGRVHLGHHGRLGRRVRAAQGRGVAPVLHRPSRPGRAPRGRPRRRRRAPDRAGRRTTRCDTPHVASSWRQTAPAATRGAVERAEARSRTSRMSPVSYLMAPARSAWPGRASVMGFGRAVARPRLDRHALGPVGPVAVGDAEGERRAQRPAEAQAGRPGDAVLLDLHAPAAAVAVLAPRQLAVHGGRGDAQPGRQPVEDAGQARTVGFAGRQESQASQGHRLRVSRSVQNEG